MVIIISKCPTSSSSLHFLYSLHFSALSQCCQQRARSSLFYKSSHNLLALEILPYYIPNNHLSRLCTHHQLSYIHPYARTNTYKYSFFLRTISEWNSLPMQLKQSLLQHCQLFKASLTPIYIITIIFFIISYNLDFLSTVMYIIT